MSALRVTVSPLLPRALAFVLSAVVLALAVFMLGPQYTLFTALGLVVVLLLLHRPTMGLYLLVILVPFNGVVTQILGGGPVATAYGAGKDFILLGLMIITIVSGRLLPLPGWLFGLVALMVTVPLIASLSTPSAGQALYGWRNDYEPLLLLLIVPALLERSQVERLLGVFVTVVQVAAAVAIASWTLGVQWLFDIGVLPVQRRKDFPTALFTAGSDRPRAFSPFVGPNELAVVMVAALAVIWLLPALRTRYRLLLSVLPLIAVLLSESRSGLLGVLVVLSVLAAHGIHRRSPLLTGGFVVVAVISVIAGAFLYITDRLGDDGDPSVGGHLTSLASGMQTMFDHPLGLGLGVVGPRAQQYAGSYLVESFLLLLALESGIVVLLIYLILLVRVSRVSLRAHGGLGFLSVAVIAGTAVSQLVLPTFQEGAVSFLVWLLVGIGLVAAREPSPVEDVVETPQQQRRVASAGARAGGGAVPASPLGPRLRSDAADAAPYRSPLAGGKGLAALARDKRS